MNIYYQRRQQLDIKKFWREIAKMSLVPIVLVCAGLYAANNLFANTATVSFMVVAGAVFTIVYGVLFWHFSMNKSEKDLFAAPAKQIVARLRNKA